MTVGRIRVTKTILRMRESRFGEYVEDLTQTLTRENSGGPRAAAVSAQLSEAFSALSTTRTSAGAFVDSNFRPSWS